MTPVLIGVKASKIGGLKPQNRGETHIVREVEFNYYPRTNHMSPPQDGFFER